MKSEPDTLLSPAVTMAIIKNMVPAVSIKDNIGFERLTINRAY